MPGRAAQGTQTVQRKIKTLAEVAEICGAARKAGHTVVLAHGTFDLLHVGHVRHLQAARREGSMLIVTVTADAHVNKGPGRPVFAEQLRAEMLASLEYVDYVAINHAPSAEPVLNAVKPSVYIKGSDYKDAAVDVTGKIVSERAAVEAHGGRLAFTDEIEYSSSNLINKYMNVHDRDLQDYLERMREGGALERMLALIERVKDYRVLVVGDAILDEYTYVRPLGKAPKENMIASLFTTRETFAGGVFAAANHVASFCKEVEVLTTLGTESHERLIRDSLRENVNLSALHRDDVPTTRKTRFVDDYSLRKLFEVYEMDDQPIRGEIFEAFGRELRTRVTEFDLVIVTDFGHGLLHAGNVAILIDGAPFLAVNAQSNSANYGYNLITKYDRADYVCVDGPEARLAAGDKYAGMPDVVSVILPNIIDCPNIVVTQGKNGCLAWRRGDGLHRVPALTGTIVDTVGAGDAFFSVTAPFVHAGASTTDVGFLGNAAGALKVGIMGHRNSVEKVPFVKFITSLLK